MTRKRNRDLRKCAHYSSRICPYTRPVEAGKFKCDICARESAGILHKVDVSTGGDRKI